MTLSDDRASMVVIGLCDDGSDDSIASPRIAEAAGLKDIGGVKSIVSVTVLYALKRGDAAQNFTFSRSWCIPHSTLYLSSGCLALQNISFLVANDGLACEDVLIGYPVLQHLRIESKTLTESNHSALDATGC